MTKKSRGPWARSYTGKIYHFLDPSPDEIDIEDIAISLARCCRYNRMIPAFYSVAEHSILVSKNVSEEHALVGLLHDAPEAYLGDLVRPLRKALRHLRGLDLRHANGGELSNFDAIHDKFWAAICDHFGLEHSLPAEVEEADDRTINREHKALDLDMDRTYDQPTLPAIDDGLKLYGPEEAREAFLERFRELMA